jgi:hypothetical protein
MFSTRASELISVYRHAGAVHSISKYSTVNDVVVYYDDDINDIRDVSTR